jgi:hypothetical protein
LTLIIFYVPILALPTRYGVGSPSPSATTTTCDRLLNYGLHRQKERLCRAHSIEVGGEVIALADRQTADLQVVFYEN